MRNVLMLVLALVGCSAGSSTPTPQPAAEPTAQSAESPGYLGFGFTYHKPNADTQSSGWLLVRHVPDDGPARRAGLKPQTLITAINGRLLDFPDDVGVLNLLKSIRPGAVVRLSLAGNDAKELVIVATEMPPDKLRIWKANFDPAPAKPPR